MQSPSLTQETCTVCLNNISSQSVDKTCLTHLQATQNAYVHE